MIKIDEIKIKGFKKIKKAEVQLFPGANLLLGHNEEGKTSLEDAIIYALTDSIQGQSKGAFIEAINDQCKTASVTITGQAGTSPFNIKRTLAKTNRSGPSPVQVGAQLGVDPHILSACLNASYYFNLPPDYQKKLIIRALGLKPTLKDAFIALHEKRRAWNVCQEFWNEEVIREIDHFGWDAGYNMAYDLRRETGREIKILENNRPQLIEQVSMDEKPVPMGKILAVHKKKPLSEQEKEHKTRLSDLHKELGGIEALSESDKERYLRILEGDKAERDELLEAVKVWTKEDTAELGKLKSAKQEFEIKIKGDITTLENLADTAESILLENKEKWESDVVCPIPKTSGQKMCPAVQPDWSEQQKEIDEAWARVKTLEETIFPGQEILDNFIRKGNECKDRQDRVGELNDHIQKLEEKLECSKPEMAEKRTMIEAAITNTEKKLEHLEIAQQAIDWNLKTQETLDATQTKIDETTAKHEHYDELCRLLAPDGIPGELVSEKLGVLNARLKEHAPMMGVEILFLDDLSLVQADKKQLWTLGGAETSRVKMALAEAISHVTGVGLLLLDELNISVAADSTRVRSWLVDIGKTTQIVAAAATNAPGPPTVPENAPVRMFWVESGNITKL